MEKVEIINFLKLARTFPFCPHLALSTRVHSLEGSSVSVKAISMLDCSCLSFEPIYVSLKPWSWSPALIPALWTWASFPDFIKFLERTESMVSFYCSLHINHNLGRSWWKMRNSDWEAGESGSRGKGIECSVHFTWVQPPRPCGFLAGFILKQQQSGDPKLVTGWGEGWSWGGAQF